MFGKLKDKLKSALSVFSSKAEQEAEDVSEKEESVEEQIDEPAQAEKSNKDVEETKEVKEPKEEPSEVIVPEEQTGKEVEQPKEEPSEVIEPEEQTGKEVKEPGKDIEQPKEEPSDVIEPEEQTGKEVEQPKEEPSEFIVPEEQTGKEVEEPSTEIEQSAKEPALETPIPETSKETPHNKPVHQRKSSKEKLAEELEEVEEEIKEVEEGPAVHIPIEQSSTTPDVEFPQSEPKKKSFFKRLFSKEEPEESARKATEEIDLLVKEPETAEDLSAKETKSFLSKVKESITTKTISAEKFDTLFWELEVALLENNVSVEVIEKIKEDLKQELVDKPLPRDVPSKINETLRNTLDQILTFDQIDIIAKAKSKKPLVIAFFGVNGAGKTTSIAKLAHYLQDNDFSVVLAACDTFRAAAIQQLEEHANKLGVKMIKHEYGSDAAAVAFDATKYAEKNNVDVVLIDTAGRLHSNTNLMAELEKIIRVTKPDLNIFIGESITGNDCIEQAKRFGELVQLDGVILTKADVDEKGGAPLSIAYTVKKPILFLGMGQEYDDFEVFDKKIILDRLGL
jgi:fused signal recognition particle receptor